MCDLCKQYGSQEHGDGVWYLNPYNYARNMYKLRAPGVAHQGVEASPETATSLSEPPKRVCLRPPTLLHQQ